MIRLPCDNGSANVDAIQANVTRERSKYEDADGDDNIVDVDDNGPCLIRAAAETEL